MTYALDHIALLVRDLDESIQFLIEVIGLSEIANPMGGTAIRWAGALDAYFAEYDRIGTGPDARSSALVDIEVNGRQWRVRQVFDDPDGDRDWAITAEVDLDASDEVGEPVVQVVDVGPFDASP